MVRAVDRRTHQVDRAGVDPDVFLVDVLLVDRLRDDRAVGCQHEAAHLGVDGDVIHARGDQRLFIGLADALADDEDVVRGLVGLVGHADAAGQVDEGDVRPGLVTQVDGQLKELFRELRIVLVGDRVGCKERVDAEVLDALFHEGLVGFDHLGFGHAVLGVAGVVHDAVRERVDAARVVPAAHGLRQLAAAGLLAEVDVGDVIEVDDGAQLVRVGVFLEGSVVGGEHDVVAGEAQRLRHHEFGPGRAVRAAVILRQQFHDARVRRRLDGKVLPEARVPGKRLFHVFHVAADARLVIEVKRSRVGLDDFLDLFLRDKCLFFHSEIAPFRGDLF